MTWGDWVDGTPEDFEAYTQEDVDLSGVMVNFPNGLMRVGDVADEINFNTQLAISKINRIAYTEENLESIIASGLAYDTDQNYIYHVRSEYTTYSIDIDGSYNANDHGTEFFTGITIPVYATIIYGQDLAGKLRRDVVTISPMDLSPEQQAQVRASIGAIDISGIQGYIRVEKKTIASNISLAATGTSGSYILNEYDTPQISGYTPVGYVSYSISGSTSTYCLIYRMYLSGTNNNKITVGIRNLGSSVASVTVDVWMLYVKNV